MATFAGVVVIGLGAIVITASWFLVARWRTNRKHGSMVPSARQSEALTSLTMGDHTPQMETAPQAQSLAQRLTNGEAPRLTPRAPFALPELEDGDPATLKQGTQVLLLAATQTEREAVLERLKPPVGQHRVQRVFSGAQTYYVGRLGSVNVVLTTCRAGSQPRDGSGLVTYEAISRVHPRAVVAVGMAFGGYTGKLKIGDVLVSTHVIPYEPSRKQANSDEHRGGEHDAGSLLLNRFLEARDWTFARSDGYGCQVRDGRVLSGEKLVDSLEFKAQLFVEHPEAIGGEMEGSGLYAASERQYITEWLIVKSVCDWGDGTKHKEHQPLAATVAVALVDYVFGPDGVLDDLPPFKGPGDGASAAGSPPIVVSNVSTTIGQQNIVHGNQIIVHAASSDLDALLSNIKALLKKGLVDEAGASIDEADSRMWDRLAPAQRARLRALRGWRKAILGDSAGAALDFHDAHDQNPNDERALINKCQAFMLQDLRDEAYKVAKTGVSRFASNATLRAHLIKSAPDEVAIDELLPAHWRKTALASEIAAPGAERVRMTNPALAETILRRVDKPEQDDFDYWKALGIVLIQQIEAGEDLHQEVAANTREEAIRALQTASNGFHGPAGRELRGHLAFMISEQSRRLGRADDRRLWLESARELIPNSIFVVAGRAQDAYEQGNNQLAASLLRPVANDKNRPEGLRLVLADSLLRLGSSEARNEAHAVLDATATDETEPPGVRRRAAGILIESCLDVDLSAATAYVERHRVVLGEYQAKRFTVVIAQESGNKDEALTAATEMLASRTRYSQDDVRDLGWLLGRLGMHEECVEVLEAIAPRNVLASSTIALLNAAMKCGRLELVASICKALRTAGVEDAQIIDGEAYVRSLQGDLTGALELVQQWLAKHPDDKRIRLRLSLLAYELGRVGLLPTRAEDLPQPTDAQPEIAVHIVQVLRAANQQQAARDFAYANFKKRRRDEWAWKALSFAALPDVPATPDASADAPSSAAELRAGPGLAIRIKEGATEKWIQLEESAELATAEDEYPPSHPMTVALTGKKVGDEVELQKSRFGLPPRTVTIIGLVSCFTRTSQECNDSYELQFPQSPFIHSFQVPDSVDDLIALLAASLKERHDSVDALVRSYGENPRVTLHGLAKLCDRSLFELIPFLASTCTTIHASPPPARMQAGRDSLQRTREIVVETTAISTLAMLEMLDQAKGHFTKIWIARGTLDRLRAYIQTAISSGASGHMGLEGGELVVSQRDPAFETKRAEYLRKLLTWVESWDVFHEAERDQLDSTSWDAWTEAAGGGTAESVHYAKRRGLALWTDDVMIAACAEHEGASPISTQAVFETLNATGIVGRDELAAIGAKLVGWGYVDIRTPPESFLAAARLAKWDPSARPLLQHMELLTKADWPPEALALVVAEVFRLSWNDTMDRKAVDALVVASSIRLAARANGERVLRLLLVAIQKRFGLDVIGARHVSEVIVAWSRSRLIRR